jgi:CubicO group peptidase (beta-lactamase class C family)
MRYLIALTVAASTVAAAQSPDRNREAAIDRLVTRMMADRHIPGVAVAVVERGAVTLQRAYGVANLETDTPLTASAIFELASVTKPITAGAIMMLVEDGKVQLDEPISTYMEVKTSYLESMYVI